MGNTWASVSSNLTNNLHAWGLFLGTIRNSHQPCWCKRFGSVILPFSCNQPCLMGNQLINPQAHGVLTFAETSCNNLPKCWVWKPALKPLSQTPTPNGVPVSSQEKCVSTGVCLNGFFVFHVQPCSASTGDRHPPPATRTSDQTLTVEAKGRL
jgi:hypothetical protein